MIFFSFNRKLFNQSYLLYIQFIINKFISLYRSLFHTNYCACCVMLWEYGEELDQLRKTILYLADFFFLVQSHFRPHTHTLTNTSECSAYFSIVLLIFELEINSTIKSNYLNGLQEHSLEMRPSDMRRSSRSTRKWLPIRKKIQLYRCVLG